MVLPVLTDIPLFKVELWTPNVCIDAFACSGNQCIGRISLTAYPSMFYYVLLLRVFRELMTLSCREYIVPTKASSFKF